MDAEAKIIEATQTVICRNGLSSLSIQRIADELDQSKSAVYYHYESKHDLIINFLDHLHAQLKETIRCVDNDNPIKTVEDLVFELGSIETDDERNLRMAIMSLQAEAPHDEDIARRFKAIEQTVNDTFADLFSSLGVDEPERVAALTVAVIDGVVNRSLSYEVAEKNEVVLESFLQRFI